MRLKYILLLATAAMILHPVTAAAQANGTNSTYSRFGVGLPCDQSQSYNRSMGGVAQGLRNGSRVNMQNPASYSAMDSLTFLFDLGMGLQRTRYTQGGAHVAANNTSFDHLNAAFRVTRNLGMSVGFLPYTKIGYSFTQTRDVGIDPYTNQNITNTFVYSGSGGLHQAYIGAGWQPFKGFSIGANLGFIWGDIKHQITQSFEENGTTNSSSFSSLRTYNTASIATWKADIGLQYQARLNQEQRLTFGATVGIGHKLGGDATFLRTAISGDTIRATSTKAFSIPMTYSFGVAWEHSKRLSGNAPARELTLAADVTMEQWSNSYTPQFDANDRSYTPQKGAYSDRWRVNAGAEFIPERYSHHFLRRINYRIGGYYSTPYLNIVTNGQQLNGPAEYGLTAGVGLPITNKYNNRSYVNVGVGWSRREATAELIDENILSIHIGLTFNERWFMKWKFK